VEFFAPLCGGHLRRSQYFLFGAIALAIIGAALAGVTDWFPMNILAVLPGVAAVWMWSQARRGGLPCRVESGTNELSFYYARPLTARTPADPNHYLSYRPPPPPVPFEYLPAKPYSREEITATGRLLTGQSFALLPDRILAFLDISDLKIDSPLSFVWKPPSGEIPWLPPELHDGSDRARRGLALFVRKDDGPFVYAGRAELTNWPIGGMDCWAQFTLDEPFRSPILQLAPSVEQALRSCEVSGERETLLRRAAVGDAHAWEELTDLISHQGDVSGEFVPLVPFLFALLKDPGFPHKEDLMWTFALAAKSPADIRLAAAQGVDTFLAMLDGENQGLRMPAAFSLHGCHGISEPLRLRAGRESHEEVRAAMIAVLGASRDPGVLPFLLEEIRSGRTIFLKSIAAVAAVEAAGEKAPAEAVRFLQEHPWVEFEQRWADIDPGGMGPLNPQDVVDRL
jgi:hypothetical protein